MRREGSHFAGWFCGVYGGFVGGICRRLAFHRDILSLVSKVFLLQERGLESFSRSRGEGLMSYHFLGLAIITGGCGRSVCGKASGEVW